jgi:hypothetical protein
MLDNELGSTPAFLLSLWISICAPPSKEQYVLAWRLKLQEIKAYLKVEGLKIVKDLLGNE